MNEPMRSALSRAKSHARTIAQHVRDARQALANGDTDVAGKHIRAASRWGDYLEIAHDDLADALGHDPDANPTAAMGAQTSSGQSPRDAVTWAARLFAPERRR